MGNVFVRALSTPKQGEVPMRPSPQNRAVSILLAEFNPQFRSAVRSILLYQQFSKITEVSDSKNFIDAVRASSFDVILLDSSIPNLDAIVVTRFIRSGKLGVNPAVVIILLSHRSDMTFIYEAREAGVTEIVAKPFSSAALMARLTNALEKPRPFITSDGYTGPCWRTGEVESVIEPPKERIGDHLAARSDDLVILSRDAS
jgi:two-component system chemotaxis response regulator CheY